MTARFMTLPNVGCPARGTANVTTGEGMSAWIPRNVSCEERLKIRTEKRKASQVPDLSACANYNVSKFVLELSLFSSLDSRFPSRNPIKTDPLQTSFS